MITLTDPKTSSFTNLAKTPLLFEWETWTPASQNFPAGNDIAIAKVKLKALTDSQTSRLATYDKTLKDIHADIAQAQEELDKAAESVREKGSKAEVLEQVEGAFSRRGIQSFALEGILKEFEVSDLILLFKNCQFRSFLRGLFYLTGWQSLVCIIMSMLVSPTSAPILIHYVPRGIPQRNALIALEQEIGETKHESKQESPALQKPSCFPLVAFWVWICTGSDKVLPEAAYWWVHSWPELWKAKIPHWQGF